jgi:hypothetical protein
MSGRFGSTEEAAARLPAMWRRAFWWRSADVMAISGFEKSARLARGGLLFHVELRAPRVCNVQRRCGPPPTNLARCTHTPACWPELTQLGRQQQSPSIRRTVCRPIQIPGSRAL